ncbi:hypothetical protein WSM22_12220 [Cytophagales bacterium WSM2-2]|nr:hypothetical protein WSM22_12220 [Cytophagales bacterium WSM2-2]
MCSDQLGTLDYVSIADHTIPFVVYYDVSLGTSGQVTYFTLKNFSDACGITAASANWLLTELDPVTGAPLGVPPGNIFLNFASGILSRVQGTPNLLTSPYRFEVKMTVGGTDYIQQFMIYVTQPMDVSLVLDISGSMATQADPSTPGVNRLDVLKAATGKFLDYFKFFSASTPGVLIPDRVGVVYFTDATTLFPADGSLANSFLDCTDPMIICVDNIKADINAKTPLNSTGMGKGIMEGLKQLTRPDHFQVRNLVLFTDGIQNVPLPTITADATSVSFDAGAPAGDYLPDLPAGTSIPTVANYTGIKISTIGLAVSGSYFDNLNKIAQRTNGFFNAVPITKTADLDDAFLYNLTQIMRGGSPQIVDIARGNLSSGSASAEFNLNKSVAGLVFDITSLGRSNTTSAVVLPFTIEKDGVDVTSSGKIINGFGYKGWAVSFPKKVGTNLLKPEGKWVVKLTGQQAEPYKVILLADDHTLKYEGKIESKGFVSDTLKLNLKLAIHKMPVKNATVKAIVLKPGQDLGTLLATSAPKQGKDIPGAGDLTSGNVKLQTLLQDPQVYQSLLPKDQAVTLTSNNDGTYSAIFTTTDVTGPYQVLFSVEGDDPMTGKYFRTDLQSTVLLMDAVDLGNSAPAVTRSKDTLKIAFRPRSVSGLYLGPDFKASIQITSSAGTPGTLVDQVDGTYAIVFSGIPEGTDPDIKVNVFGKKVFEGKASDFTSSSSSWWMTYWWVILIVLIILIFFLRKIFK